MATTTIFPNTDLKVRKEIGRAYLNSGRLEEALSTYAGILKDFPQDVEAYLFLGDCYLAEGELDSAAGLYTEAMRQDPGNANIYSRLQLTRVETIAAPPFRDARQTEDNDDKGIETFSRMLHSLNGRQTPVSEDEIRRAVELFQMVLTDPEPALVVADHLDEIDDLLPALIEMNIRQARLDGRPDLVSALQHLQENIRLQIGLQAAPHKPIEIPDRPAPRTPPRVLLLSPDATNPPLRKKLVADALTAAGCETVLANSYKSSDISGFQAVIFYRPHCDPHLMGLMAECSARGIPAILDLDLDFEQMPAFHPEYDALGLGTLANARAFNAALFMASHIVVSSQAMLVNLQSSGLKAQLIPDGWTSANELWHKSVPHPHSLNIGWVGEPGQPEDVIEVRRIVMRVMREFPQTRLVIVGSPDVYQLFERLPETQRLFLPAADYEDFPYLLGQIDLLLIPLRNLPYNRTISDRQLMEAGVRSIPWITSPLPAAYEWGAGGLIANNLDEWYAHLRQLVLDENLRATLGSRGRQKSEQREMKRLANDWINMIVEVTA